MNEIKYWYDYNTAVLKGLLDWIVFNGVGFRVFVQATIQYHPSFSPNSVTLTAAL